MIREKIEQAIQILNEKNIDLWMTFVRETGVMPDPMLDYIVGTHATWQSAFIITREGLTIAIVGSLDVANQKDKGYYQEVIGYVQSIKEDLLKVLERLNPRTIAINFSKNTVVADGLTTGMYLQLLEYLEETPFKERLVSAEPIISALRGRKTAQEIERMKQAIAETLDIFTKAGEFMRPGVSEQEVANFILAEVKARGLETAWEQDHCPAVFSGPETAGAHASPTARKIQPGHVINIDFGVKVNGYCSDLQRTWYVLRPGERQAPEEVERGFRIIKEAIQLAAKALKPGVQGKDIDRIARQYIVDNGYEEYPHALGHQIGRAAHDGGGLLAPEWERYGELPYQPVEEGQVYTLEPRLTIPGYGIATIEEMVWVHADGCEFISPPQEELWLIPSEK